MNRKVWIFGLLSACCLAASDTPGLPKEIYPFLRALAAIGAVVAAYHYPAPTGGGGSGPVAVLFVLLLLAVAAVGCRVAGLDLAVSSPTFGSVGLSVDGGSIGTTLPRKMPQKAVSATNSPTLEPPVLLQRSLP